MPLMTSPAPAPGQEGATPERDKRAAAVWRGLRRNPTAMAGLVIVAFFVLVALLAPRLAPHNPTLVDLSQRLKGPSPAHPFGTDGVGLDVYSRVIYGARID